MEFWVRVKRNGDDPYYWDLKSGRTKWELASDCSWNLEKTSDGAIYYWNEVTMESRWTMPLDVPPLAGGQPRPRHPLPTGSPGSVAGEDPWLPPGREEQWPGWPFGIWLIGEGVPNFQQFDHERPIFRRALPSRSPQAKAPSPDEVAASWVEICDVDPSTAFARAPGGALRYYWNFRSSTTTQKPPPGVNVQWQGFRAACGRWYFINATTRQTAWRLPGMGDDDSGPPQMQGWMEEGSALAVHGLRAQSWYNDRAGHLLGFAHGRAQLQLPDTFGGTVLCLRPENLRPLPVGTLVELRGLQKTADLNGKMGTVEKVVEDRFRYQVRLAEAPAGGFAGGSSSSQVSVPANKLRPRSRLWGLDLRAAAEQGEDLTCLFIDSGGQHRRYHMHLPSDFLQVQDDYEKALRKAGGGERPCPAWPLLVHMHGNGGGPFFATTGKKKARKSVGYEYAGSSFIIVSPAADWTWKQTPKPWVNELVATLRAAQWVDPARVYLTGCSMGGMGTWEVAAARPELYAAIAPVAAYHKLERREYLAAQLRTVPVFAVHSVGDMTCPLGGEEPLWKQLVHGGNIWMQVSVGVDHDHTFMFERAYCDSATLYKWLLMFRDPDA